MEKLELGGTTPPDEQCAQTLWEDYAEVARIEARTWREQLIRECGQPPEGCSLLTMSSPHDFGTIYSVGVRVGDVESHWDYFHKLEESGSEWDDQALKDLCERLRIPDELGVKLTGVPDYRELVSVWYDRRTQAARARR